MTKRTVTTKVFRYNPDTDPYPSYKNYEVPIEEKTMVLQVLKSIYDDQDRTLAFRRFSCGYKFCNSCLMTINGKAANACRTIVEPGDEITVEPLGGYPIIRDLVVDFGRSIHTPDGAFKIQKGTFLRRISEQ